MPETGPYSGFEHLLVDPYPLFWFSVCITPLMPQKTNLSDQAVFKFVLPFELKEKLERIAQERGLSVAALVRLVLSDYIKSKR